MSTDEDPQAAGQNGVHPVPLILDYNAIPDNRDDLLGNISAVAQAGNHLWLASDEGTTIERLVRNGNLYGSAQSVSLAEYFPFPQTKHPEIDVEALAVDDGHLWIAGSHSRARHKKVPVGGLPSLPEPRQARCFLGRLKLSENGGAIASPKDGRRPCLGYTPDGNLLTKALEQDPLIGPFVLLPDKENGVDIEGLAVSGDRVMLGCRGPVIRDHALVVELSVRKDDHSLALNQIDGRLYRTHLLPLDGLGIRDLVADGDDIILIAGPTMGSSGPFSVKRWVGGLKRIEAGAVAKENIRPEFILDLRPDDHPEGITLLRPPSGGRAWWLIVHDNPAPSRLADAGRYIADLYPAPAS